MSETDWRKILSTKPETSPAFLKELHVHGNSCVKLAIDVQPWWKEVSLGKCSTLVFEAANVEECSTSFSEAPLWTFESLELADDHPVLLDFGPTASIFGQAPLPDPYRFLLEFHRLVRETLGIPRDPIKYLNWQGGVGEWLGIVYSRSYNLLRAPIVVADAAKDLLDAQMASYIVLPDEPKVSPTEHMVLVIDKRSWIIAPEFSISEEGLTLP